MAAGLPEERARPGVSFGHGLPMQASALLQRGSIQRANKRESVAFDTTGGRRLRRTPKTKKPRKGAFVFWRRDRDSNPGTPVRMLLEFQSSAFDRSAISP